MMGRPKELIKSYQGGVITQLELTSLLIRSVGRDGKKALDEFTVYVTGVLLAHVLEDVTKSPWTDEGWDKCLIAGSYCGSAASRDLDKIMVESRNKILAESRAGIEMLRAHYGIKQGD
jgi:hypothetical protein